MWPHYPNWPLVAVLPTCWEGHKRRGQALPMGVTVVGSQSPLRVSEVRSPCSFPEELWSVWGSVIIIFHWETFYFFPKTWSSQSLTAFWPWQWAKVTLQLICQGCVDLLCIYRVTKDQFLTISPLLCYVKLLQSLYFILKILIYCCFMTPHNPPHTAIFLAYTVQIITRNEWFC